jgi:hypothetical protein
LGVAVKEKMYSVLNKNPDLNCLKLIKDVHCEMYEVICRMSLLFWTLEI